MKGSLSLEFIGCNVADQLRQFEAIEQLTGYRKPDEPRPHYGPLVAEISRSTNGEIVETPIYGRRDYSRANSKGSRGVHVHYILKPDTLYRVAAPKSWRNVDRYYAAVAPDGSIYRLSDEEVRAWLSEL